MVLKQPKKPFGCLALPSITGKSSSEIVEENWRALFPSQLFLRRRGRGGGITQGGEFYSGDDEEEEEEEERKHPRLGKEKLKPFVDRFCK